MANGDARIALQILLRVGKKAEDKGLKQITIEEVKQVAREVRKFKKTLNETSINLS